MYFVLLKKEGGLICIAENIYFLHENYVCIVERMILLHHVIAESICTHYSNLSGRPDIFLGSGTLKKQGPKYGVQKAGCKKQGHCYSKREEGSCFFSF